MHADFDPGFDWSAFHRVDRSTTVSFLSALASGFDSLGILSVKDTDNLRLGLSGLNLNGAFDSSPSVLVDLEREKSDFLGLLLARFGEEGLTLNLLRYALVPCFRKIHQRFLRLGLLLGRKGEIFLNRSMLLTAGQNRSRRVLVADLLAEWSEQMLQGSEDWGELSQLLLQLNGHSMDGTFAADRSLDLVLAQTLGFDQVFYAMIPGESEVSILEDTRNLLGRTARVYVQYLGQLQKGLDLEGVAPTVFLTESLKDAAHRLPQESLGESAGLLVLELRRQKIVALLMMVDQLLERIEGLVDRGLSVTDSASVAPSWILTQGAMRRVAYDLMMTQVPAKSAWTGAQALCRYLEDHRLKPHSMLASELPRVNPILTAGSLETLASVSELSLKGDDSLSNKGDLVRRLEGLGRAFTKALQHPIVAIFVVSLGLLGCGLKTDPHSEVLEYRPDIPFREPEPSPRRGSAPPVDVPPTKTLPSAAQ